VRIKHQGVRGTTFHRAACKVEVAQHLVARLANIGVFVAHCAPIAVPVAQILEFARGLQTPRHLGTGAQNLKMND
jgi:hypothetical protein